MATNDLEDVHLCLRCNTQVEGLLNYVQHRQTNCVSPQSEVQQTEADTKGDINETDGDTGLVQDHVQVKEEILAGNHTATDERSEESSSGTLRSSKRGRKRKAPPSGQLSPTPKTPDTSKNHGNQESTESPGKSPEPNVRRSGRQGIRISYTDLLSGVDRSELDKNVTVKSERQRGGVDTQNTHASPKYGNRKMRRKSSGGDGGALDKEKCLPSPKKETMNTRGRPAKGITSAKSHKSPKRKSVRAGKKFSKGEDKKKEEFLCDVCNFSCFCQSAMDKHCATNKHLRNVKRVREELFQLCCSACGAEFTSQEELEEHGDCSSQEWLTCSDCNYTAKGEGLMERHMRSISHAQKTNVELFSCDRCHRKYKDKEALELHQKSHDIPQCPECKSHFDTVELLDEHMAAENHKKKSHQCPVCEKSFSSKGNLKVHQRIHEGDRRYKCELCKFSANQTVDLQRHMLRHQGIKLFKCTLCSFETVTKYAVDRHMRTHTHRTRDHHCDECNNSFYDETLLKQHKYQVHNPERRFPCDFEGCTFAFKYQSSLISHRRMHTQEKPYLCAECGFATATKHSLTKHIRLHTGEKPFRCDFPNCTYASRLSTHLTRHKRLHTGAKPYKCPFCPYACNAQENLRKHVYNTKTHAGLKLYKCKSCEEFSSNSFRDYVVHIRKEHSQNEYVRFQKVAESVKNVDPVPGGRYTQNISVALEDGADGFDPQEIETFSVITVIPNSDEAGGYKVGTAIMDEREDVQKKLEEVILALEETNGVIASQSTGGDNSQAAEGEAGVSVAMEPDDQQVVSITVKDTGESVVVPEVQAETEISTSDVPRMDYTEQYVVETTSRLVSEEDMAAATWLQNMQNVSMETILQDVHTAEEGRE